MRTADKGRYTPTNTVGKLAKVKLKIRNWYNNSDVL